MVTGPSLTNSTAIVAENSRRDSDSALAQRPHKFLVEFVCLFRGRSGNKARSSLAARVTVKCELRDNERAALLLSNSERFIFC